MSGVSKTVSKNSAPEVSKKNKPSFVDVLGVDEAEFRTLYRAQLGKSYGEKYLEAMGPNYYPATPPAAGEEYHTGLQAHDKTAEDKSPEEFKAWFYRFAKAVTEGGSEAKLAWDTVKGKCDIVVLTTSLYLMTYRGKTDADILQDACRVWKEEIDKLKFLSKYNSLCEELSALRDNPKLKVLVALDKRIGTLLNDPAQLLGDAKGILEVCREWAASKCHEQIDPHDLHLYKMAHMLKAATGEYHLAELAPLIGAASVAQLADNIRHDTVSAENIKRRLLRFKERWNLPISHRAESES